MEYEEGLPENAYIKAPMRFLSLRSLLILTHFNALGVVLTPLTISALKIGMGGSKFTGIALRPVAEGTFQEYSRNKGQYKVP